MLQCICCACSQGDASVRWRMGQCLCASLEIAGLHCSSEKGMRAMSWSGSRHCVPNLKAASARPHGIDDQR